VFVSMFDRVISSVHHAREKEDRMATVGYLEGTDPLILTKLEVEGIDTTPISNGFDNHGKYINHLSARDGLSAVIGYLHKVMPTPAMTLAPGDLLFACFRHEIPVLLVVESSDQERAAGLLAEASDHVRLVDPAELYAAVVELVS
jgi:hypothetical protein